VKQSRFNTVEVDTWSHFFKWYSEFREKRDTPKKRWIFRGEGRQHETLSTSLEREAERSQIPFAQLPKIEGQLLNEFRRRLHHYSPHTPHPGDLAEWLSLMRHFGAPTPLLDWSYSPFVALFFAVERAYTGECVIWSLDSIPYTGARVIRDLGAAKVHDNFKKAKERTSFSPEKTKTAQAEVIQYLFNHPTSAIVLVSPFRVSERTSIQQSVHLMPGDLTKPFESNLDAIPRSRDSLTRLLIHMTPQLRKEMLTHLHRMNIDRATLFPGLQGFAESLQTRMAIPEALSW